MAEHKFKDFITSLLKKAGVNSKYTQLLTSEKYLNEFRLSFTHDSYNEKENYETYEFLGDPTVNDIIAQYIHAKFPTIVSVKWLTRIKHNLMSKKQLAVLAEECGFFEHILYGDEIIESLAQNPDLHNNNDYLSMLEDVLEAFIGCLVSCLNSMELQGVGYAVASKFFQTLLSGVEIEIDFEKVFDAKSRLKEIYDKMGWQFGKNVFYSEELKNKTGYVTYVYAYVNGDKRAFDTNKVFLTYVQGKTKTESEMAAAQRAIEILERSYKIYQIKSNPYEK